MLMRLMPLIFSVVLGSGAAHAQSSLGIQGLSLEAGYGAGDDGRTTLSGLAQLDVRVTPVHGLQLDVGLIDRDTVVLGQLGAHLYMQPVQGQKYGLFAVVSDVDGYSVQYITAGIEGRVALSDRTAADLRFGIGSTTGMGGASAGQWDYVFAGAGVLRSLNDTTTIEGRIDVTEFDELAFRAIGVDSQLRLTRSARGSNISVYGELRNAALFGRDARTAITTIGAGLTFNLGQSGETLMDRPFQIATPFDQLVTRGIVASF